MGHKSKTRRKRVATAATTPVRRAVRLRNLGSVAMDSYHRNGTLSPIADFTRYRPTTQPRYVADPKMVAIIAYELRQTQGAPIDAQAERIATSLLRAAGFDAAAG